MKDNRSVIFGNTNIRQVGTVELPPYLFNKNKDYFSFNVSGNGMINIGIRDGDAVIFEYTDHLENGEVGCMLVDGQPICKRYFYNKDYKLHVLQYEDGKQAPILVNENQDFKILGKLFMKLNKV